MPLLSTTITLPTDEQIDKVNPIYYVDCSLFDNKEMYIINLIDDILFDTKTRVEQWDNYTHYYTHLYLLSSIYKTIMGVGDLLDKDLFGYHTNGVRVLFSDDVPITHFYGLTLNIMDAPDDCRGIGLSIVSDEFAKYVKSLNNVKAFW